MSADIIARGMAAQNRSGMAASAGSSLVGHIAPATGAVVRTAQSKLRDIVSVKDFGAIGDGTANDSAAFAAAIAHANAQAFAAAGTGLPIGAAKVFVPAGDYVVNTGVTVTDLRCEIVGAGREVTRIKLGAGQYFLTVTAAIYQTTISGLSFSGGKGAFIHTSTGVNVRGHVVLSGNNFNEYTECAIGSLASDFPYWKIHGNLFYGTLTSKGIVLSGYADNCSITDNSFLLNRYHIKLARAQNAKIERNDFLRFTSGAGAPVLTDMWIVPHASYVNSGSGLRVVGNKFGNENLYTTDYRLLFADEAAGTNAFDKNHAATPSTGYVIGPEFDNYVAGVGGQTKGFIYSYTPNVQSVTVRNIWTAPPPYVIQYDAGITVTNDRTNDSNVIDLTNVLGGSEQKFGLATSSPQVTYANDPMSLLAGSASFYQNQTAGFDPGLVDLWNQSTSSVNAFSLISMTRAAAVDSTGDADAGTLTFTAADGFSYGYMASPTNGRLAWAEIEIKAAASQSLTQVDVQVKCENGDVLMRRVVAVPATWQRLRLPFIARALATPATLQVRAIAADYSAGVRDKVMVGRPRAYHAAEPVNFAARHLQALATYDWPSIANGASAATTLTVTGAVLGDFAQASLGISQGGLTLSAYVSATDTVTVVATNNTGAAVDLASTTLRVRVTKSVSYA